MHTCGSDQGSVATSSEVLAQRCLDRAQNLSTTAKLLSAGSRWPVAQDGAEFSKDEIPMKRCVSSTFET